VRGTLSGGFAPDGSGGAFEGGELLEVFGKHIHLSENQPQPLHNVINHILAPKYAHLNYGLNSLDSSDPFSTIHRN
jgi:hypothetical protein